MITDKERFSAALKKARNHLGLPQTEVADKIGIKVTALSRYERGDVLPSVAVAAQLAKALNCSLDELCGLANGKDNLLINELNGLVNSCNDTQLKALITVLKTNP